MAMVSYEEGSRKRRRVSLDGEQDSEVQVGGRNSDNRVVLRPRLGKRPGAVVVGKSLDIGMHVAFVLDISGSMRKDDVDGAESRIDAVFQAVADFLDDAARWCSVLKSQPSVYSLVLFNDTKEIPFTMVPVDVARDELVLARRNTVPRGGTHYGKGFQGLTETVDHAENALQVMSRAGLKHVAVFLSDGKPGDHVAEGLLADLVKRLKPEMFTLHAVGFGPETRDAWRHGLARLADLGGGMFFDNEGVPADFATPGFPDTPASSPATLEAGNQTIARPGITQVKTESRFSPGESSQLSAVKLSATFTHLAKTIATTMNAASKSDTFHPIQPAPALGKFYASLSEAEPSAESWLALRWVESGGVLKVLGGFYDETIAVGNEDVLAVVANRDFGTRFVKWCSQPFARGSMRSVHQMWDVTSELSRCESLVAKKPLLSTEHGESANMTMLEMNRGFLEMHGHARKCAEQFNKRSQGRAVSFVGASVYILLKPCRTIAHCFNAEQYLSGVYRKFNDNNGHVFNVGTDAYFLAQAFSHFSFEFANSKSIIVDIQGDEYTWTDPQMHSLDGARYGRGDLGERGIARFFSAHRCNMYCERLGLAVPCRYEASTAVVDVDGLTPETMKSELSAVSATNGGSFQENIYLQRSTPRKAVPKARFEEARANPCRYASTAVVGVDGLTPETMKSELSAGTSTKGCYARAALVDVDGLKPETRKTKGGSFQDIPSLQRRMSLQAVPKARFEEARVVVDVDGSPLSAGTSTRGGSFQDIPSLQRRVPLKAVPKARFEEARA